MERWEAVSNHFLEFQFDKEDSIWIMVHSGSRNIGKRLCDFFNEIAEKHGKRWYSKSTIPFLPVDCSDGKEYLTWLEFTSRFAFLNRKIMLNDVIANLSHYFPNMKITTGELFSELKDGLINIHHNYAALEHHMGSNWYVHRKGATLARKGTVGLIPGSMETKSFVVVGIGETISLNSCSHGSGRACGRKEFNTKNKDNVQTIRDRLVSKGIVFTEFSKATRGKDEGMFDVSETGDAYKDVVSVINDEADLVQAVVELTPIISLKG